MRRKPGTLLPLEVAILAAAVDLRGRGREDFHGYLIASEMQERERARLLTAHGTLYKALDRMRKAGFLSDRWEDPELAAEAARPRRRLYRITALGQAAVERARAAEREADGRTAPGWQPT